MKKDTRKFRKRPVVIEAIKLKERVEIRTLEGVMVGEPGDWLITGVKGEKYPYKPDIFEETYEPVDGDASSDSEDCRHVTVIEKAILRSIERND